MISKLDGSGLQPARGSIRSGPLVMSAAIIAFWICVFISRQPTPFIDDIFYTGAAINFAKHGVMYNPHLRLSFPFLTSFNIYPPTEQFALGYWLTFWGISTNSMLAFFMVCNAVTSLAAMRLINYFKLHSLNIILSVLIIANTVLFLGLRVEAFSLACISTGLALVITKAEKYYSAFVGSFLSVIGSISAPSYLIPGILWFLTAVYFSFCKGTNSARKLTWVCFGSSAAGLAFLSSINFNVGEFLRNFLFHSRMAFTPPKLGLVLILLTIAIAACASSSRLRLTSIALGITTISFVTNPGPRGWEPLLLVCITGIISLETLLSEKPQWAMALRSALLVSLCVIALPWIGYAMHHLLAHRSQAELDALEKSKALVSSFENLGKSIAIDPFVARRYFDYRIPSGAVDWYFGILVADRQGYRLREDVREEGINGIWLLDSFVLQNYYGSVDRLGFGDIREAAISSQKAVFPMSFSWWRIRLFELTPMRFMNRIFFGQNFIRFSPLGGSEDPILIDVESRKVYRGDQVIFEGNHARSQLEYGVTHEVFPRR
jgi:hypothetical protein